MQARQSGVSDGVIAHGLQAGLVESPHVPDGQQPGRHQRIAAQHIAGAAGLSLIVDQHHPLAHQKLEAVFRRAKDYGYRLQHPGTAPQAELRGCYPAVIQDTYLFQRIEKTRIDQAVDRLGNARKNHQGFPLGSPADRHGQLAVVFFRPLALIRGIDDLPGLRLQHIGAHRHPSQGKPGNGHPPFLIGQVEVRHPHSFVRLVPHSHGPGRPGPQGHQRVRNHPVRHLAAAGEGPHLHGQGAQLVLQDRLEIFQILEEFGIAEGPGKNRVEKSGLPRQVFAVDPGGTIQRRVHPEAGVIHGRKGQRDQPGIHGHLAVYAHPSRHVGSPVQALDGADAVHQTLLGLSPLSLSHFFGIGGEPAAEGHEKPLQVVAVGVVPYPQPIGLAGQIQTDEELGVQRLFHALGIVLVGAGVPIQKVDYASPDLKMGPGGQQHDGAFGGVVLQVAGQLEQCRYTAGHLCGRGQGRHH